MVEKNTAITPTRDERRAELSRPLGWDASPRSALQRFASEIDRMFDDFGIGRRRAAPLSQEPLGVAWAPEVEVFQKNGELTIKADLPGLKREEVSVDITDDAVTIQGERRQEHHEEREGLYRSERSYGSFCRIIPLPESAITEQAKASFRDGVLEVTMPAPPTAKGRRLEIAEGPKK